MRRGGGDVGGGEVALNGGEANLKVMMLPQNDFFFIKLETH